MIAPGSAMPSWRPQLAFPPPRTPSRLRGADRNDRRDPLQRLVQRHCRCGTPDVSGTVDQGRSGDADRTVARDNHLRRSESALARDGDIELIDNACDADAAAEHHEPRSRNVSCDRAAHRDRRGVQHYKGHLHRRHGAARRRSHAHRTCFRNRWSFHDANVQLVFRERSQSLLADCGNERGPATDRSGGDELPRLHGLGRHQFDKPHLPERLSQHHRRRYPSGARGWHALLLEGARIHPTGRWGNTRPQTPSPRQRLRRRRWRSIARWYRSRTRSAAPCPAWCQHHQQWNRVVVRTHGECNHLYQWPAGRDDARSARDRIDCADNGVVRAADGHRCGQLLSDRSSVLDHARRNRDAANDHDHAGGGRGAGSHAHCSGEQRNRRFNRADVCLDRRSWIYSLLVEHRDERGNAPSYRRGENLWRLHCIGHDRWHEPHAAGPASDRGHLPTTLNPGTQYFWTVLPGQRLRHRGASFRRRQLHHRRWPGANNCPQYNERDVQCHGKWRQPADAEHDPGHEHRNRQPDRDGDGCCHISGGTTDRLARTESLTSSTAPGNLTLTALTGALGAGTYNATIPITSAATGVTNSPQVVAVTFIVTNRATWDAPPPMPVATYGMTAATVGNLIYLLGGNSSPTSCFTAPMASAFDPVANTWTSRTAPPVNFEAGFFPTNGNAVVNGKIYVPGGSGSLGIYSQMFIYDPAADMWSTGANMSADLAAGGGISVAVNGKVYVLGGASDQLATNAFYSYDPSTDQWSLLPSPPHGHWSGGAAAAGGRIYLVGGQKSGSDGSASNLATDIFDPASNTSTTGASLPTTVRRRSDRNRLHRCYRR